MNLRTIKKATNPTKRGSLTRIRMYLLPLFYQRQGGISMYKRNILLGLLIGLGIATIATPKIILFIAIVAMLLLILEFDEYQLNDILKGADQLGKNHSNIKERID